MDCTLVWKEITSKKGTTFEALVAVFPNGKETIVSFDYRVYYSCKKNSN